MAMLAWPQVAFAQQKKLDPADYVGRYGNKEITARDGGLYFQRVGGRGAVLRPTGKDSFALNEDAKITFIRDAKGAVVEMAMDWVSQEDQKYKREPLTGGSQPGTREPMPEQTSTGNGAESGEPVDARTVQELKVIMTHLLQTIYVSPEMGTRLARQLQTKFETGGYKVAATSAQLAQAVTRDLREWGNDKHLSVKYDPARSTEETILEPATWAKQKDLMFQQGPGPGAGTRSPEMERMAARLKADNYHFRQAKTLDGNVGYIELAGFAPGEAARQKAAETMAQLAGSDALIIDLRDCPGGTTEMINFLASYFFEGEPRVLMNRHIRPTGERVQSKTLAEIPGKRMLETDLYILVGPRTVSAGESFAYTMQQWGRAKIVGETTAGAGYNNVLIPLGQGMVFSISYGRPEHPRSGKGWQVVGVQPDIAVATGDALEAAHKAALQKIGIKPATVGSEQEVRTLERAWLDAYEQNDAVAMERILADEFAITFGNGRRQTKAEVLESVKARDNSAAPPSKFSTEEVEARIEGETVVLTGRLSQRSERRGEPMTMQFSYTDTYARRDGRWQVVSSRLSRL